MVNSMLLIISITLIGGIMLAGAEIYTKTVVMDSKADIQLDRIKAYSCEEMIKTHTTAHYLSAENKQYATQKVKSCEK